LHYKVQLFFFIFIFKDTCISILASKNKTKEIFQRFLLLQSLSSIEKKTTYEIKTAIQKVNILQLKKVSNTHTGSCVEWEMIAWENERESWKIIIFLDGALFHFVIIIYYELCISLSHSPSFFLSYMPSKFMMWMHSVANNKQNRRETGFFVCAQHHWLNFLCCCIVKTLKGTVCEICIFLFFQKFLFTFYFILF
jgi:hypothetical protein